MKIKEVHGQISKRQKRRFCRIFKSTYAALPNDVRNALEADWPLKDRFIALMDDSRPCVYAVAYPSGMVIFGTAAIQRMPDRILSILIAHELGHCYFRAIRRESKGLHDM